MHRLVCISFIILYSCKTNQPSSNQVYSYNANVETRWSSPENLNGIKGAGGKENRGAKGHPSDNILAGQVKTLLDIQGQGIINRIWFTINERSVEMLRSLKIEMYWDNETKPAVSVPVGDFFGLAQGMVKFENELFSSPEARSFNCFVQMPFRKAAKITITNEAGTKLSSIFFDVDYSLIKKWNDDFLYFHAWWNRDTATTLAQDFVLLPEIKGRGRILGTNVTVNANKLYKKSWWGEGEVKMFIDGDKQYPTLAGTGTEDYIGTGWGQGTYSHRYAGCLWANDSTDRWSFYRYHIPDPVYFSSDIRITMQQIGGNMKSIVQKMQQEKVPLIPITVDDMEKSGTLIKLYENNITDLNQANLPEAWTNFYRSDDVSAATFFYLDAPSVNLPAMPSLSLRTANLR